MAEAQFAVVYEGPVLDDGTMPVREIAPALLALGEVFVAASLEAYPEQEPVALNIRATGEGSFLVQLALHSPDAWTEFVHLFSGPVVTALANLKGFVIGGGAAEGLFWLVRRLHDRRVDSQERLPSGVIRLRLDDGMEIEIPAEVFALYRNVEVRKRVREVVEPVTRDGVERVKFISDGRVTVSVDSVDASAYDVPEPQEERLGTHSVDLTLEITSPSFIEDNKWRFFDGASRFAAAIEDIAFLHRVKQGAEAFRAGDMLDCRLEIDQVRTGTELQSEHRVTEVYKHIPRPDQLALPGTESTEASSGQSASELREDRQVDMESDPSDSPDAERK